MNCGPLSKTTHLGSLWSFQTWWRNSLAASSVVTIVYIRMKYALFDTKSTTIITTSCPDDLGSSTMKSMLRVSHHVSRTGRG